MTNTEAIDACGEVCVRLCNMFNDPEKENCPGCPFDGTDSRCPLGALVELAADADEADGWKEKYERAREEMRELDMELDRCKEQYDRLDSFVMSLSRMVGPVYEITRHGGVYEFSRYETCDTAQELLDEVGM